MKQIKKNRFDFKACWLLVVLAIFTSGAVITTIPGQEADTAIVETDMTSESVRVPEVTELAMQYYRSGNLLWIVNTIWGFCLPAIILFTGLSARLRTWARALGRWRFFEIVVYLILFMVLLFIINIPLNYYQEFVRPHAYGLSNLSFQKWIGDSLKGLMVSIVLASLVMWIPYFLIRRSPRRWWLYSSLAAIPLMFLMIAIAPVWIAPLFNDFGPMRDKALKSEILSLAERAGIDGGRVFEVEKSVDTETVNAYVTGFLNTKRIVLWDTLLKKLNRKQVHFVMGHEMGHYVLGHIWKTILLVCLVLLVGLYLSSRIGNWTVRRFREQLRFEELADVASLPLLLLLLNLLVFVASPILLWHSRVQEREADQFGLELTLDKSAAALSFVKLQEENLGNPRPGWLFRTWRASHPPLGERIDFCNSFRSGKEE